LVLPQQLRREANREKEGCLRELGLRNFDVFMFLLFNV
jgi:hypothetical protein